MRSTVAVYMSSRHTVFRINCGTEHNNTKILSTYTSSPTALDNISWENMNLTGLSELQAIVT